MSLLSKTQDAKPKKDYSPASNERNIDQTSDIMQRVNVFSPDQSNILLNKRDMQDMAKRPKLMDENSN